MVATVLVVIKVWGVRESDHLLLQILLWGDWIPELTGALAVFMTILLLGPLNFILDKLWKTPAEPMWPVSYKHLNLWTIIWKVMLAESRTSLLVNATIALGTILGYSAMAGAVGGGGLGDIAIRYGYYRYQTDIMLVTVVLLVLCLLYTSRCV